jgi:hypothetical protein
LLEFVHGDLCGPVMPATPGSRRYFLLLVDDATRYMWVALLTTKDAAADAIKHLQAVAEKGRLTVKPSCSYLLFLFLLFTV